MTTTSSAVKTANSEDKLIVYPNILNDFYGSDDIGYVMYHIYDRVNASRIAGDSVSTSNAVDANGGLIDPAAAIQGSAGEKVGFERLDKVIVLPMPSNLSHPTTVSLDTQNNALVNGAIAGYNDGGITGAFTAGISGLVGQKFGGTEIGRTVTSKGGFIVNDRKEQFFQGVEFRRFEFLYTFTPESREEAKLIQDIVKRFRVYMLPSKNPGKLSYFITPSEFLIKFFTGGKENLSIPRISRCLLQNCTVNYSPRSQWIQTKGGEGFPNEITMTLSFAEKQTLFREAVKDENY